MRSESEGERRGESTAELASSTFEDNTEVLARRRQLAITRRGREHQWGLPGTVDVTLPLALPRITLPKGDARGPAEGIRRHARALRAGHDV